MSTSMEAILARAGERKLVAEGRKKLPARVFAFYNGKLVDMDYVPDPKRRFNFAGMRVSDNASKGYVLDGEKVYAITRASRTAKLLSGDDREAALAEIAGGS